MIGKGSAPQQAAAVPFRRDSTGVRVCIIRRKNSAVWGIPKGLIDPGETSRQTALKETLEEAGLRGQLIGDPIGTYDYEKWGTIFRVAVYLLEVHDQQDAWQEAQYRERMWVSFDEAASLLSSHPVWPLLDRARSRLAGVA